MSFRMLLTPEDAQQFWPVFEQNQGAGHHGMVRQAQCNHHVQLRLAGNAVMNGETSLPASRFAAHAASMAITLQHGLAQPSKILLVLPFERVTGRAEPDRKNLRIPAAAMHGTLTFLLHPCSRSASRPRLISTAIQPSFHGSVRSSSKGTPLALASSPESKRLPQVSSKWYSLPSAEACLWRADSRASAG